MTFMFTNIISSLSRFAKIDTHVFCPSSKVQLSMCNQKMPINSIIIIISLCIFTRKNVQLNDKPLSWPYLLRDKSFCQFIFVEQIRDIIKVCLQIAVAKTIFRASLGILLVFNDFIVNQF